MKDKITLLVMFFKRTWIGWLVIAIVLIAGISSVEIIREEVLNIDPDVEYVESDTISLSCEALDTLNPVISQSEDVYHLSKLIYNSLFDYDETLNVVPELVDEYTTDTDRGKVVIKLKEGIAWHNGGEVTARDVYYTINAIKSAGTKSLYYEQVRGISYVYVKNNYDLEIFFGNVYDASLDDLTFPILPSSQFVTAGQLAAASDNFKPVGSGQYQYQSYNYLKQLRLKPNKEYWGTRASKKLKIMILPEKELSSNMLEIESVTCYVDTGSERKSTVIDKNLVMYDMVSNEVEFLLFNPGSVLVQEKTLRHAIAKGINEDNILENGYMNDGILTDTIYYPDFLGVEDEGTYDSYSPETSAELLESLEYTDKDNDGFRENSSGKTLELRVAVNKNNATRLAAARLIKKDLEAVGIKVVLSELTWKEYQNIIASGQYDILLTGFTVNEQYDLRSFYNGTNEWGYYNDTLLRLANELERIHTAEEYQTIFQDLKAALLDELPYYSLCYRRIGLVGVQGFTADKVPMFNDYYKNIDTWSWTYAVVTEQKTGAETDTKSESGDYEAADE